MTISLHPGAEDTRHAALSTPSRPGTHRVHPGQRPLGAGPPGVPLPPGHDRHRHPAGPRQHRPRPRELARRLRRPRHLRRLVRPLPRLGTLRTTPRTLPAPAGSRHRLRRPAPVHRHTGLDPRLRGRLHPAARRTALRLAGGRRLRRGRDPDPGRRLRRRPGVPWRPDQRPAAPGLLRPRRCGRCHAAQPDAPRRRGQPGADRDPGPPRCQRRRRGRTRTTGPRDARLRRQDPARSGPRRRRAGPLLRPDGPAHRPAPGGTGRQIRPTGRRRITGTPLRPAARVRPRRRGGHHRRTPFQDDGLHPEARTEHRVPHPRRHTRTPGPPGRRPATAHRRLRGDGERRPARPPHLPRRPRGHQGRRPARQRVRRRAGPARGHHPRRPQAGLPTSDSSGWSNARLPSAPASGSARARRPRAPRSASNSRRPPWRPGPRPPDRRPRDRRPRGRRPRVQLRVQLRRTRLRAPSRSRTTPSAPPPSHPRPHDT